jgi:GNAT superfamily N-acetyltransferase
MEIVELDTASVSAHRGELAQLLLDAHEANMALGLRSPLSPERAASAWEEMAARLEPGNRVMLGCFEDGLLVGAVQFARAEADNGASRAEVQRLAVRADRRGSGYGKALLEAIAERAREAGVKVLWLTTHADTPSDTFYERVGWTRLGAIPSYSQRPDGTLAASAFFYREL